MMRTRDFDDGRIIERPQVVWLTLGGLTALGLMFAAGYVVGRRAARIEPAETAPGDALRRIDSDAEMHEKLTFYEELTEPSRPTPPPAAVPLVPRPAAVASAERPAEPEAPRTSPAPQPPTAGPPSEVKRALDAGPAQSGDFTVQVSAFQSREEAQAFAAGLERRGFHPFVVTSAVAGRGTWYRVRVGRFRDEASAKAAKSLLAASDIPAWVLRTE